jgi:hypothetical protein
VEIWDRQDLKENKESLALKALRGIPEPKAFPDLKEFKVMLDLRALKV